ncbi:MAG: hypothetical protein MJ101_04630 [Clostridia bacterium]|nr:hypothetical protein [Clostridia bacterium]
MMKKMFLRGIVPLFAVPCAVVLLLSALWALGVYYLPLDCEDALSVLYQVINIVIYVLLFCVAGAVWHAAFKFTGAGWLICAIYVPIAALLPLISFACEHLILIDYLSAGELGEMLIQSLLRCLTLMIYAVLTVVAPAAVRLIYRVTHRDVTAPRRTFSVKSPVVQTAAVCFVAMLAQGVLAELAGGADGQTFTDILIFTAMYLILSVIAVISAALAARRENG